MLLGREKKKDEHSLQQGCKHEEELPCLNFPILSRCHRLAELGDCAREIAILVPLSPHKYRYMDTGYHRPGLAAITHLFLPKSIRYNQHSMP